MSQPVRKIIIPVAGLGTRFLPATKAMPKEMLPIIDKPVIQYVVEEAVASGITDVILVTSHAKRPVEDHFDDNEELESMLERQGKLDLLEEIRRISKLANFIYVRQKGPYGTATPVLNASNLIGDEPFAVVYGDEIYLGDQPRVKQMIDVYEEYQKPVIGVVPTDDAGTKRYGIVEPKKEVRPGVFQLDNLLEKPGPEKTTSRLAANAGYILTPAIFPYLQKLGPSKNGEYVLAEAIQQMMKKEQTYACTINGEYHDTGSKIGWIKANVAMALKRPDMAEEMRDVVKSFRNK
ncbi:MAG: UTP--glucose-1-phosphate uridylyltransferase [Patescibacteria group bacterium]